MSKAVKRKCIVDENDFLVVGPSVEKRLMRAYNKANIPQKQKREYWNSLVRAHRNKDRMKRKIRAVKKMTKQISKTK